MKDSIFTIDDAHKISVPTEMPTLRMIEKYQRLVCLLRKQPGDPITFANKHSASRKLRIARSSS